MVLLSKDVTQVPGYLALHDKVINTAKAKMADILKNEEINTMILYHWCWCRGRLLT